MLIRYENRVADTEAAIIRRYASINKAKKAMRGAQGARVAEDHKAFASLRKTHAPNVRSYGEEVVK